MYKTSFYVTNYFIKLREWKGMQVFLSLELYNDLCFRFSKTKKIVIIGSVTFVVLVIVALAISLPIALKNRDDNSNSTSSNSNTMTSPESFNETHMATSSMYIL